MGVVHLFGQRKALDKDDSESQSAANSNGQSAEVIELVVNAKIAKNVPAKTVYRQIEALMVSEGMDLNCDKNKSDFKIISYLVQGMYDRQDGTVSHRSMLGETLRFVFDGEQKANDDDTNELFGDLLGQI
jgi:hypothetical protein